MSWTDVVSCLVLGLLLTFIVWQNFDPRGLIFFGLLLGAAELIVQLRWRVSIACPYCGFDPVLYRKNSARAAEQVKQHLDRRRADPNYILSTKPFINLPVRRSRRKPAAEPEA
ncbi:MAG TPA: hypothetical protein VFV50_11460 [Bdellovibrionales bacterium]|nr:hypothetical protein [Bdellovibrionales bacterium]